MEKPPLPSWIIRSQLESDIPFLYATWTNCIKTSSSLGKLFRNGSVFYKAFHELIDQILLAPDSKIFVACLPDDTHVILGFMVTQGKIGHFLFVKRPFQRMGIGKALYQAAGSPQEYSFQTNSLHSTLEKMPELIYNPFKVCVKFKQNEVTSGKA